MNVMNTGGIEAKSQKTKDSKYFKDFPEIRQMNCLTMKSKKPSLLPNGSICQRPITIDKKNFSFNIPVPSIHWPILS